MSDKNRKFLSTLDNLSESLNLGYLWSIFLKNKKDILLLPCIFALFVFLISLNIEKIYSSTATLVIKGDNNKIGNIEEVYTQDTQVNRVNNQIAILKSEEVLENTFKNNNLITKFNEIKISTEIPFYTRIFTKKNNFDEKNIKKYLKDNFTVTNIPRSDVLELSFESTSPKIAQLALNSIIDSYQKYEIDSKIKITSYANQKISERLKELNDQMNESQIKLATYKKTNGLVDTGNVKQIKIEEIQSLSKRVQDTEKSILENEADLGAIKLANGNVEELLAIKDLKTRDEIKNIKNLLSSNQNNINSLKLIYTEDHPKLIKTRELEKLQNEQLKKLLNENIQLKTFELSNLMSFLVASKKGLESSTKEFRELEDKEAGMLYFQREVESNQKLYETFLQRLKETNEAQNLQVSNIQLIELPNVPIIPIFPNLLKNLVIGYILALFASFSFIFYREVNVEVVKDPSSVEHLGFQTLAYIPKVSNLKKGFHLLQGYLEDNNSNFSESIRMLRTNLEANYPKNKTYLITSANPSEGKTTVAFNLALSLEKHNKVLLIEGDIKRPSVVKSYYQFESGETGLSDIISGSSRFEDSLVRVPGTNLDMITSGANRFDISDAVSVTQLKQFFKVLTSIYDYVIIDSPPVLPVADTLVISQATDFTFFVLRSEQSRILPTIISANKLKDIGVKIEGFIFNDMDTSLGNYYGEYYKDYYRYNNKAK